MSTTAAAANSVLRWTSQAVRRLHPTRTVRSIHSAAPLAKHKIDISGIYPPITTPFDDHENIDWLSLKDNMTKWNEIPFKGYVVQGSNGEYAYMTTEERLQLVRRVKSMMADDKLLLAGSGCESTAATIDMTNKMAELGADAALVITPCFYKSGMTDDAMFAHYSRVADNSTIPIILYSVPANTGIDLSAHVRIQSV